LTEAAEPNGSNASPDRLSDGVPMRYAGLVTRAVALALDVVAIIALAALLVAVVDLVAGAFGHHGGFGIAEATIGAVLYAIWVVSYFAGFWNLAGQTPGDRLLGIRVVRPNGELISSRQAALRFVGTVLAALPLGAGFLPVLFNDRRRALNDMIADTVVIWVDSESLPDAQDESVLFAD
jgi:uncharacterized RDD family membrane protein YckC